MLKENFSEISEIFKINRLGRKAGPSFDSRKEKRVQKGARKGNDHFVRGLKADFCSEV